MNHQLGIELDPVSGSTRFHPHIPAPTTRARRNADFATVPLIVIGSALPGVNGSFAVWSTASAEAEPAESDLGSAPNCFDSVGLAMASR